MCRWREARNRANCEWEPWCMLSPAGGLVHQDGRSLSLHGGPSAGGPHGVVGGVICGGTTQAMDWATKSEWESHDRSLLSPTNIHWNWWLHCMSLPQPRALWTPLTSLACQNCTGFGMVAVNCLQELKIRPTCIVLSSLNWEGAGRWLLFPLSTAAQRASIWILFLTWIAWDSSMN